MYWDLFRQLFLLFSHFLVCSLPAGIFPHFVSVPFPSKSFEKWSAFTLGDQGGKQRVSYFKRCHCHFGTHLKATIFFVFKALVCGFLIGTEADDTEGLVTFRNTEMSCSAIPHHHWPSLSHLDVQSTPRIYTTIFPKLEMLAWIVSMLASKDFNLSMELNWEDSHILIHSSKCLLVKFVTRNANKVLYPFLSSFILWERIIYGNMTKEW